MKSKMKTAPAPQRQKSTVKDSREARTARPAKGRQMNTPRVAIAPPPLERKRSPKY